MPILAQIRHRMTPVPGMLQKVWVYALGFHGEFSMTGFFFVPSRPNCTSATASCFSSYRSGVTSTRSPSVLQFMALRLAKSESSGMETGALDAGKLRGPFV
jgi:hypothetical protein